MTSTLATLATCACVHADRKFGKGVYQCLCNGSCYLLGDKDLPLRLLFAKHSPGLFTDFSADPLATSSSKVLTVHTKRQAVLMYHC